MYSWRTPAYGPGLFTKTRKQSALFEVLCHRSLPALHCEGQEIIGTPHPLRDVAVKVSALGDVGSPNSSHDLNARPLDVINRDEGRVVLVSLLSKLAAKKFWLIVVRLPLAVGSVVRAPAGCRMLGPPKLSNDPASQRRLITTLTSGRLCTRRLRRGQCVGVCTRFRTGTTWLRLMGDAVVQLGGAVINC